MSVATYREAALSAALDPNHPLHLLPVVPPTVRSLLDVGCHAGHILEALNLPESCQAFGCDINGEALELARQYLPSATFAPGAAEALPYADSSFDFVFARGVMVTVDIPRALSEFNRVLKKRGTLWLSLHRWDDCCHIYRGTWKEHRSKTLALAAYTFANSQLFHHTGKVFHYPLHKGRIMSFQTEERMRKELGKAGFGAVEFSHGKYLVVQGHKAREVAHPAQMS